MKKHEIIETLRSIINTDLAFNDPIALKLRDVIASLLSGECCVDVCIESADPADTSKCLHNKECKVNDFKCGCKCDYCDIDCCNDDIDLECDMCGGDPCECDAMWETLERDDDRD